jgi:hypothetical protein
MKQHEKGSLTTDVPKDADRYWSTADVECEKAMIRIGGVPTIISRRSVFLDKHSLDPTGGLDSYRLTKEMGRRNRNQRQRQDVKNGTIAEKSFRCEDGVKRIEAGADVHTISIDRKSL